jgi:electron transport complex protein RnfG
MREFFRLAGTLTIICMFAAGALSYTFSVTQPTIEANRLQKKLAMIEAVLPPFDNKPDQDSIRLTNPKGEAVDFYIAKKDGKPTGVAFQSTAQGYSSRIVIMIGLTPEGKIYGLRILDQSETPGLGNKISKDTFTQQFINKDLSSSRWDVKKLKGDFDQVTAATISSKAFIRGVQEGLSLYQANAGRILKGE